MTKGPAGWVHSRVVANVQAATLNAFVRETVSHKVSLLCTDQWVGYNSLDKDFPHATVDHAKGHMSSALSHTRTIELILTCFHRRMVTAPLVGTDPRRIVSTDREIEARKESAESAVWDA